MITNITYFINESGIVTQMNKVDSNIETWISNGSMTYIYKSKPIKYKIIFINKLIIKIII
jgi:hypothetical protein